MPDRITHSWHFEPVVQIGERVLLMTNIGLILGEVTWLEPVPSLVVTTDTITNGQTLDREMKEIYVEDNEFAQWRMQIITDGIYLIEHRCPNASPYWVTKHAEGQLPPASNYNVIEPVKRLQLTEFYQYKDTSRYMKFLNNSGSDTTATIQFFGYIFQFEEIGKYKKLKEVERPYTAIPCVARCVKGT